MATLTLSSLPYPTEAKDLLGRASACRMRATAGLLGAATEAVNRVSKVRPSVSAAKAPLADIVVEAAWKSDLLP